MVLATNRRTMSPTTIPLTPPSGFCKAVVNRPTRSPSMISMGTSPVASREHAATKSIESTSLSRVDKWSAVILEGPAAAPCRSSDGHQKLHRVQFERPLRNAVHNLLTQLFSGQRWPSLRISQFGQRCHVSRYVSNTPLAASSPIPR